MPGDYSRETFRRTRHYSGVRIEQGRVQVDADSNEQLAIEHHRIGVETIDVVGISGAPKHDAGFAIGLTPDFGDLTISPGRMYVEGLLCEIESSSVPVTFPIDTTPAALNTLRGSFLFGPRPISFSSNRVALGSLFLDDLPLKIGDWVELSALNVKAQQFRIVQIDPKLPILTLSSDVSAFRGQAQAALRRVTTYTTQPDFPNPDFTKTLTSPPISPALGETVLNLPDGTSIVFLEAWQREITALDDPHIREVALGGPDTATRLKTVWQVRLLPTAVSSPPNILNCASTVPEWDRLIARPTGMMNARTTPASNDQNPCQLPPQAGYQRLENQLYRVQVHSGGAALANCTFVWSRENASVETTIQSIAGSVITVSDLGKDDVLGFGGNQWVELIDNESELRGVVRSLLQIDHVTPATNQITMTSAVPNIDLSSVVKLRRWDQSGAQATQAGIQMTGDWQDLEGGIQVKFLEGSYQTGDYWLIPARTATTEIDWPPFEIPNVNPVPQSRAGTPHYFCRLALVTVVGGAIVVNRLADCRHLFPPLTELPGPDDGVHITAMNLLNPPGPLVNDTNVRIPDFTGGFAVICDTPVAAATISRATCFVTLEMPQISPNQNPPGYTPFILSALLSVSADGTAIFWHPTPEAATFLNALTVSLDQRILARFVLKGNFIWSAADPFLFLDGNAFGVRAPGSSNTALRFPSGDGKKGGDFEMWFWLFKPPTTPFTMSVSAVSVQVRPEGLTEVVADLVFQGLGGAPTPSGSFVPEYRIIVTFGAPVTNVVAGNGLDAVLLLCDPVDFAKPSLLNTQRFNAATPPVPGVGGTGVNYQDGSVPNIFQAQATLGLPQNSILFPAVPIDAPGSGQRPMRIKNVRLNANSLGGAAGGVSTISATVTITGASPVLLAPNTAIVGTAQPSAIFSVNSLTGAPGPVHISANAANPALLAPGASNVSAQMHLVLTFTELFASAFKARKGTSGSPFTIDLGDETAWDNNGTGALAIASGPPLAAGLGAASTGTRFEVAFQALPSNIRMFLTTRDVPVTAVTGVDNPPARAILVSLNGNPVKGPVSPGHVPLSPLSNTSQGIPILELTFANRAATAEFEFVDAVSQNTNDVLRFGVVLVSADPGVATPPTVAGAIGPFVSTANPKAIPRFVSTAVTLPMFVVP